MRKWIARIRIVVRELGHLTPMAILVLFMPIVGFTLLFVFISPIGEWLRTNGVTGALVFLAGVVIVCGFSMLPPNVIGLVAGWSFGFWAGLGVLMLGIIGASILSFFIGSRISGRRLPSAVSKHVQTEAVYNALIREDFYRTTLIVFLLRAALMPFAFTNFLLASARTSFAAYVLGTFGGMLPRSAAMVFVGSGASYLDPENTRDIITLTLALAGTVAAVIIVSRLSRRALRKIVDEPRGVSTDPDAGGMIDI